MTIVQGIRDCIEKSLMEGYEKFIICPFGDIGMQVKHILNEVYAIQEAYILDNHLCKYNKNIKPVSFLKSLNCKKYALILSCLIPETFEEIKKDILEYTPEINIILVNSVQNVSANSPGNTGGGVCY